MNPVIVSFISNNLTVGKNSVGMPVQLDFDKALKDTQSDDTLPKSGLSSRNNKEIANMINNIASFEKYERHNTAVIIGENRRFCICNLETKQAVSGGEVGHTNLLFSYRTGEFVSNSDGKYAQLIHKSGESIVFPLSDSAAPEEVVRNVFISSNKNILFDGSFTRIRKDLQPASGIPYTDMKRGYEFENLVDRVIEQYPHIDSDEEAKRLLRDGLNTDTPRGEDLRDVYDI